MRVLTFGWLLLALGACAARPLGPPDPTDVVLEADERFYLAAEQAGAIHLVRVDARTGTFELVGPTLPIAHLGDGSMLRQAGDRAVVFDTSGTRSFALRDGAWVDLCASVGLQRCYVRPLDARLEFLEIDPFFEEPVRDIAFVTYGGVRVGTGNGDWLAPAASHGDEPSWLVWREDERWWVAHENGVGFDKTALTLDPELAERPVRAYATNVLTADQNDRLRYRSLANGQGADLACADGTRIAPGDAYLFATCAGRIQRLADGTLAETGITAPAALTPTQLVAVTDDAYALARVSSENDAAVSLELLSAAGLPVARVDRTSAEHPSTIGPVRTRMDLRALRPRSAQVAAAITVTWNVDFGEDGASLAHENAFVVHDTSGGTRVHATGASMSGAWIPANDDHAYWVDGTSLRSVDLSTGEAADRSAGLVFLDLVD